MGRYYATQTIKTREKRWRKRSLRKRPATLKEQQGNRRVEMKSTEEGANDSINTRVAASIRFVNLRPSLAV
jgi:hypothetical protein